MNKCRIACVDKELECMNYDGFNSYQIMLWLGQGKVVTCTGGDFVIDQGQQLCTLGKWIIKVKPDVNLILDDDVFKLVCEIV